MVYTSDEIKEIAYAVVEDDAVSRLVLRRLDDSLLEVDVRNKEDNGTYVPLLDKTITSITYNADGTVQSVAYAGGPTLTYTYNADGTVHTSSDGTTTRTFSYNADGTIASVA